MKETMFLVFTMVQFLKVGREGGKMKTLYFFIFSNFEIDFYYIIYKFFLFQTTQTCMYL